MCSFRKGVTRRLSTNSYADLLYQEKIYITYLIIPSVKSKRGCVLNYIIMVLLKVSEEKPFLFAEETLSGAIRNQINENVHFQ